MSEDVPRCTCGAYMEGCYQASNYLKLRAWYCRKCNRWEPAIGRERGLKPDWLGPEIEPDEEYLDAQ